MDNKDRSALKYSGRNYDRRDTVTVFEAHRDPSKRRCGALWAPRDRGPADVSGIEPDPGPYGTQPGPKKTFERFGTPETQWDPTGPGRTRHDPSDIQQDPTGPGRSRQVPTGPCGARRNLSSRDLAGPSGTQQIPTGPNRTLWDPAESQLPGPSRAQQDPTGPNRVQQDPTGPGGRPWGLNFLYPAGPARRDPGPKARTQPDPKINLPRLEIHVQSPGAPAS